MMVKCLQVISTWTGIPLEKISKSEAQTLTSLPEELGRAVIGQETAVEAVSKAVQRSRSGMKDPSRPQATLLFAGPSGVGKTSLALALADQLFCSKVQFSAIHL
jgi:ATP-dependent Clp protease ATP-binding subunit ClpA